MEGGGEEEEAIHLHLFPNQTTLDLQILQIELEKQQQILAIL